MTSSAPPDPWRRWPAPASALAQRALRRGHELSARLLNLRRGRGPYTVPLRDLELRVEPSVFDPVLYRSGVVLADAVDAAVRAAPGRTRLLDLGTGSGASALTAAAAGAEVTAVDLNPAAVRCARGNAAHNGLEVRVLRGDLFAPVAGERFDFVSFNPPFFLGVPASEADRAWRSTDVLPRFAAALGAHLTPGGAALVLASTHGACGQLLAALTAEGFAIRPVLERRWRTEVQRVHRVERR